MTLPIDPTPALPARLRRRGRHSLPQVRLQLARIARRRALPGKGASRADIRLGKSTALLDPNIFGCFRAGVSIIFWGVLVMFIAAFAAVLAMTGLRPVGQLLVLSQRDEHLGSWLLTEPDPQRHGRREIWGRRERSFVSP